jgi:transposase-like protein
MLYHCRRDQRGLVAAALREVFNAENQDQAPDRIGHVIARLEPIAPKVCRLLEDAEEDLIAFYLLPSEQWTKLRSTNPLERVNKEIGRRTDVVGIFPNDAAVIRLAGALLSEQNDEWLVQRRYLSAESMALILALGQPRRTRSNNNTNRRSQNSTPPEKANVNVDELPALHHLLLLDCNWSIGHLGRDVRSAFPAFRQARVLQFS